MFSIKKFDSKIQELYRLECGEGGVEGGGVVAFNMFL